VQEANFDYERELLGFGKRTRFEKREPRPDEAFGKDEIIDWEKISLCFKDDF